MAMPAPAPVAAKPVVHAPVAQAPVAAPVAPSASLLEPAPGPAAVQVSPMPASVPFPIQAAPMPAPAPTPAPAPMPAPAPTPVMAAPIAAPAESVPVAVKREHTEPVVPPSPVQPVVASPFPSAPARPRRNPFDAQDAARVEAELAPTPPPAIDLTPKGSFFSRLFSKQKTSAAAVAASAASIEFTERVPKLPVDGLYAEQQRATELSFPPTQPPARKPRAAAAAPKKAERPTNGAAPAVCDRCWRRMDASGTCKTCSPSASV